MAAAQLFAAARHAEPGIPAALERGDFAPLMAWLRAHVHGQGSLLGAPELMTRATGQPLGVAAFEAHLEARYLS